MGRGGRRHVDPVRDQALDVLVACIGIDQVNSPVPIREPIDDERHEEVECVVLPIGKDAHMPVTSKVLARESNRSVPCAHALDDAVLLTYT